jgi:transposase
VTIAQVGKDFGIGESGLTNWIAVANREDGIKPGPTASELAELREAKKRIRLLEQENEVLRRAAAYLSQANLPGNDVPARP